MNVMTALGVGHSKNRGQVVVFGMVERSVNLGGMIVYAGNPNSEAARKVQKHLCISGFRLAPYKLNEQFNIPQRMFCNIQPP